MRYLKDQEEKEALNWIYKASEVAKSGLCSRAYCGSVIVADNYVIGEGYNAPPLDKKEHQMCDREFGPGKPRYDKTCCIHAEWRAIMDALRENPKKIIGSTLYFSRVLEDGSVLKSGKPLCTVCSRLALDAGITYFVLFHEEGVCEYEMGEYNLLSYEYIHVE